MRYLSQYAANRCENAVESECKCRCGGALHGAARVSDGNFSMLPSDDPHYRPSMTRAEARKFLTAAELQVIIAPQPDLPEDSWIDMPWQWRHDAYQIFRDAKARL